MRRMLNHFVISENQKRCLFSGGLEFIFMGVACSLRGACLVFSHDLSCTHKSHTPCYRGERAAVVNIL